MKQNKTIKKQPKVYLVGLLVTLTFLLGSYYLASLQHAKKQMQQQLSKNDHQLNVLKKQLNQLQQANLDMSQRIVVLENNLKVRVQPLSIGH